MGGQQRSLGCVFLASKDVRFGCYRYNAAVHSSIDIAMNRKKKINETLKNKTKKANSKLSTRHKPKYIAKADREKLALEPSIEEAVLLTL